MGLWVGKKIVKVLAIYGHGGHLGHVTVTVLINSCPSFPRKLHIKFDLICKVVSDKRSRDMRKPDFCICENKDEDQLRGIREADQRLCFRYTDSTIPLLPKSKISSP